MGTFRRAMVGIVALALLLVLVPPHPSRAAVGSCAISLNPQSIGSGETSSFTFTLSASDSVQWVMISAPNGHFAINNTASDGWNTTINGNDATFTDGFIPAGNVQDFVIEVTAGSAANTTWTIQASDDTSGSNPTTCAGDNNIQITNPAVVISNVKLTNLTTTGVVVQWDTNIPTNSRVDYGKTSSYGTDTSSGVFVTSHSLALTGLESNTGYHYQVTSADSLNSQAQSSDNTFLTATASAPVQSGDSQSDGGSQIKTVIPPAANKESVAPTITITTTISKPVASAPLIEGVADDNVAIAGVEYSKDGGQNWLPVDSAPGLGGKNVKFSFKPIILEDGNYKIMARAADTSGNQIVSSAIPLIIDALPPQVGGSIISVGPQILTNRESGRLEMVEGVEYRISTSAVGGATEVKIVGNLENTAVKSFYSLSQSADSGLWAGVLSFQKPGLYTLSADAIDGAGNHTERVLNYIEVLAPPKVTTSDNKPLTDATATLYYRNIEANRWEQWDGTPFGQEGVQKINAKGEFGLLIPPGQYYLEITARGYRKARSDIFTVNNLFALQENITLQPRRHIGNITLPTARVTRFKVSDQEASAREDKVQHPLIGKPFPDFKLITNADLPFTKLDLRGKITVLTVISSWAPGTSQELSAIKELQTNKDFRFMPIFVQERQEKVKSYLLLGGYEVPSLIDTNGVLVDNLQVGSLPTHYVLDRRGVVKKVTVGVLSKEELLKATVGQ